MNFFKIPTLSLKKQFKRGKKEKELFKQIVNSALKKRKSIEFQISDTQASPDANERLTTNQGDMSTNDPMMESQNISNKWPDMENIPSIKERTSKSFMLHKRIRNKHSKRN